MKKFVYIYFPETIEELKQIFPIGRFLPQSMFRLLFVNQKPFKLANLSKDYSLNSNWLKGHFIVCPLVANSKDSSYVYKRFVQALELAQGFGPSVIGLSKFVPAIFKNLQELKKMAHASITSGSVLGAWSAFEAVYRIAKHKKLDLSKLSVAVLGADTPAGSLFARKISAFVPRLTICASSSDKLTSLKQNIADLNKAEVKLSTDPNAAVKSANIIVTFNPEIDFNLNRIGKDTIICSLKKLPDYTKMYPDLVFIQAGHVKLPYSREIVSTSLAEAMLLTIENGFMNLIPSENINLDNLEDIANMAARHQFEIWVPQAPII